MRRIIILICAALILAAGPAVAAASPFFQTIADLPLMPGLQELPEQGMVFDKPEGRIAEGAARSETLSRDAILSFYNTALPQLGWRPAGPGLFARGTETLRVAVDDGPAGRVFRVSIAPQP